MRLARLSKGLSLALPLLPLVSQAQESIVTDRPDFTESTQLVGKRVLQVETGFTYTHQRRGVRTFGLPETLLRYTATPGVEWRLGLPSAEQTRTTGERTRRGLGDTYVGLKLLLPPLNNRTALGLIPALLVPTGAAGIRSEAYQPEVKLVWSQDLAQSRSLSGMLYLLLPREDGTRFLRFQQTVSYGLPLATGYGLFVEGVTEGGQGVQLAYQLHSGITFQPDVNHQWDVHFGIGLNRQAPASFVAAGYSFRFGGRS